MQRNVPEKFEYISILLGVCLTLFTYDMFRDPGTNVRTVHACDCRQFHQKRIHIRFPSSQCQTAVSRMSPIHSILYSSLFESARDTQLCRINKGWNISSVSSCDPVLYVPYKRWIFVWFSFYSVIFSLGRPGCCIGGTMTMFWNPVRLFCYF